MKSLKSDEFLGFQVSALRAVPSCCPCGGVLGTPKAGSCRDAQSLQRCMLEFASTAGSVKDAVPCAVHHHPQNPVPADVHQVWAVLVDPPPPPMPHNIV